MPINQGRALVGVPDGSGGLRAVLDSEAGLSIPRRAYRYPEAGLSVPRRAHLGVGILYEKGIMLKLSGNEVYYTNS